MSRMATEQPARGFAIDDWEYDRIKVLAKEKKRGIKLKNSTGEYYRFYYKGADLMSDLRMPDGSIQTSEVFKKSDVMKEQKDTFKQQMVEKIAEKNPDVPAEVTEVYADIMVEANESIKNLIRKGIDPKQAYNIVMGILRNMENTEGKSEITTQE